MTKVMVKKIKDRKLAGGAGRRLATKRIRDKAGKEYSIFVVDSSDVNFDNDIAHAFALNVSRARQANTELFGSPDGFLKPTVKFKKTARKRK